MLEATGSIIHTIPLDNAVYDQQLRLKLLEEADEVIKAKAQQALTQELADILEVIDALCRLHNISKEQLLTEQAVKREQRGSFNERLFVTKAEHLPGSFGELYCLADSEKYPEVFGSE
jgi:predicted house-cleaning noncanonical NTP pyrophosphatase (MazG superfamily)